MQKKKKKKTNIKMVTCDTWHMTHDTWHVGKVNLFSKFHLLRFGRSRWHVTPDMWHLTHDMWLVTVTHGGRWKFSQNVSFLDLLIVRLWHAVLKIWRKRITESIKESMNDKRVFRTVPATLGLLITIKISFYLIYEHIALQKWIPQW